MITDNTFYILLLVLIIILVFVMLGRRAWSRRYPKVYNRLSGKMERPLTEPRQQEIVWEVRCAESYRDWGDNEC